MSIQYHYNAYSRVVTHYIANHSAKQYFYIVMHNLTDYYQCMCVIKIRVNNAFTLGVVYTKQMMMICDLYKIIVNTVCNKSE